MTRKMFITAAPIGALPKYLDPLEPKFIPKFLLNILPNQQRKKTIEALSVGNFDYVDKGGLILKFGYEEIVTDHDLNLLSNKEKEVILNKLKEEGGTREDNNWLLYKNSRVTKESFKITKSLLYLIPEKKLIQSIILQLTSYGWIADEYGDLIWEYDKVCTYLSPDLVSQLKLSSPKVFKTFIEMGWDICQPGYQKSGKGYSPYLPILPADIIKESYNSFLEGAAIVHLHTRDVRDKFVCHIPGLGASISISAQMNHIDVNQYCEIIPKILEQDPNGIINLSTSIRGDKKYNDISLRRAHLKPYGKQGIFPDIASFTPGPVIFKGGSGYENSHEFIESQLEYFKTYKIFPEIEIFNKTILNNCILSYKNSILEACDNILFMLVLGVDQYKREVGNSNLIDDSLIPVGVIEKATNLLNSGDANSTKLAIKLIVDYTLPIVNKLRQNYSNAKISLLFNGILQSILVEVGLALNLDGIRIGMEDGLNIYDKNIGYNRRAIGTSEQVRFVRLALEEKGIGIINSEELREILNIQRQEVKLFQKVLEKLKPYARQVHNSLELPSPEKIFKLLRPLMSDYLKREKEFALQVFSYAKNEEVDPNDLANYIKNLANESNLYIRFFIEEKDRYADHKDLTFSDIYIPQSLNFAREVLSQNNFSTLILDEAIEKYSNSSLKNKCAYYKIHADQFKSAEFRFLEYLTSIPCRYNIDRINIFNLRVRTFPGYSETMAILFNTIYKLTIEMRNKSNADSKVDGLSWYIYNSLDTKAAKDTHSKVNLIAQDNLMPTLKEIEWIVVPSTPTTNYPLGNNLSFGLTGIFSNFINTMVADSKLYNSSNNFQDQVTPLKVLGIIHSGCDQDGNPVVESNMLYNRFATNGDYTGNFSHYSSRLIYEKLLLPRMVEDPDKLLYSERGELVRSKAGLPQYNNGKEAKRITAESISNLTLLKLLAHSSGITTTQQFDNLIRQDAIKLGFSDLEQFRLFDRNLVISFASASDIHLNNMGSSVIDITAFNDIRSMAGTTTDDYIINHSLRHDMGKVLQQSRVNNTNFKYGYSSPSFKFKMGTKGKTLIRLNNVFLPDDPSRLHDGHSIKNYLGSSPAWLRKWLLIIYQSPKSYGSNKILNDLAIEMFT